MTMKFFALAILLLTLSSCGMTLPVEGQMQKTKETFTGVAIGYIDGGGDLTIVLSSGTVCAGNFVRLTRENGAGVLTCDDGRSGPFEFVSIGNRGTGFGDLGGERLTFTIGVY